MSGKTLIKGGTVLSLDRSVGNLLAADVLIEDGVVTEVGAGLRARGAELVDAADAIVMPGFVDAHRHCWHSLFRNLGRGAGPVSPAELAPHYRPDDVYAATFIALLGAAAAGITTVVDWADLPGDRASVEAALQAHADAGLRTVFVLAGEGPAAVGELAGERSRRDLSFAYGAGNESGTELAADSWKTARQAGLRIHAHAGVEPSSAGALAELGAAGLLGEDVTLIHGTHLDARDLDAVASSKSMVAITPAMEMTNGWGSPPLQALIDRGIRPGLGVGSEIEAPGDAFAQMRAANSVQHATLFDLKLAGKGGVPNLLTTRDVIRYGTIDGAVAAGLGDVTGSLRPGKQGDVIVLRTDRPNIAPVNDPIGAVVWGMDTSNVDWVFVSGRALVREGRLTADVAQARDVAVSAQREVAAASGLLTEAGADRS